MVDKHGLVVGDDVSYGFNGDWYPCGKVARFSPSGKYMFTDGGEKFVLKSYNGGSGYNPKTGTWENTRVERYVSLHGGTWTVAKGIHNAQNPHF